MPYALALQAPAYLPKAAGIHALITDLSQPPSLLHGDLNDDNVMGEYTDKSLSGDEELWRPTGLIDFADSLSGDPLYDLVAVYMSVLRCCKVRLAAFLDAYLNKRGWTLGTPQRAAALKNFSYRMMCYTLLHPVNCYGVAMMFRRAELSSANTLEDVQRILWEVDIPL